ncbi:DUF4845 domain-containing protein [Pseudomonas sp. DTU_2021_1001937_2_SI_NGA_ILE_001]|uniref:DUF4845 domain-containing protein n=1 Tax=Pseudomonas sp. DTU_2021_1001937_2_SI_NGA_ILE_001 TaxID=3077589 RepID=UPI0025DE650D|nr:DUF4845 domain-containing protein [Pseudomonas sp. DTU_2021_1001937_2_SI_NGA_ILE_001]WNW11558.1 DUF4845 domain-containing protein [Pseudomonas sp. DTU_2021_1001937_2_SI_NGA_ILE_001]
MALERRQKGMSLIGLLLLLGAIGLVITLAVKMIPHYMDYFSIKQSIQLAGHNQALGVDTVDDFYSYVGKNMQVNNIRDVDLKKALTVRSEDGKFLAHLNYEQREHLFFNVDLIMTFDEQFSVAKP